MPTTGSGDTTMSYAELYDDGGPYGNHSPICNASYTFHTVNSIGRYRVEVQSNLTHPAGNARLNVYNGSVSNVNLMCSCPTGQGGVFYSTGSTVTVNFTADDDMPTQGFKIILCEFDNDVASQPNMSYTDSTTLRVRWNGRFASTQWRVDWAIVCENVDLDTFFANPSNYTSDTLSTRELYIYNIPVGCWVVYRIYADPVTECSPTVSGNGPVYQPPSVCPCVMPTSYTVTELADSVTISWTSDTTVSTWHLWSTGGSIDTVLSGNVFEITIPYDYPCFGTALMINGNCTTTCNALYVMLPSGGCRETVGILNRVAADATTITFSWSDVQDSLARYVITMKCLDGLPPTFDSILDTLPYGTTQYTVTNLHPHTNYCFKVIVLCSDGSPTCFNSTACFYTTIDNCIDFFDLHYNNAVHFTYGTYNNPTQTHALNTGRHVAIVDSTLRDPQTAYRLRCVPPDEDVSFRLGDPNIGAQAETVTFDYFVDSLDKDMLLLKYAVVMQNPNHNSTNQPHFTMEILDVTGHILDTACCYADFYASGDIGFNTVPGSNVIWKDWTTVGIDIASYHGQMIKIRFTTKDCADGGHFGYAYFTIHCDSKRIALVNLCESLDSVRMRVPLGFDYRWTHGDDTTVISTQNEIVVPADSTVYHCYATFIGKPECNFVVTSRAILPYPKAAFSYTIDTCRQQIILHNQSYIDIDSIYLPYVRQTIDNIHWSVNGTSLLGDTIVVDASGPTPFLVTLFCSLSNSHCTDSATILLNPDISHSSLILGDTSACTGDTVLLSALVSPAALASFHWHTLSTDPTLSIIATHDTTAFIVATYRHCIDTVFHHLSVHNLNNDTIAMEACYGDPDTLGFHFDQTGLYTLHLTNRYGCDSLSTLDITVHPAYNDTLSVVSCNQPFNNGEFGVDTSGFYTHSYTTTHGCDSIYNLSFLRTIPFADTANVEILYGDTYTFIDTGLSASGHYLRSYIDRYGCDSVYNLNLNVIYLQFPNAVTPNGDGYSDILEIVGLLGSTIFDTPKISVYDRWGRLIYHCENIKTLSDFWDPNKTASPDGTYFYRFTVSTSNHQIQHNSPVEVVRTH